MIIDGKLMKLLENIPTDYSVTADWLAERAGVSSRTVRTRIAQLNEILKKNGAQILSRPHTGYRLEIVDAESFERFDHETGRSVSYIPQTSQERTAFLMKQLLETADYRKLDDISDLLFIRKGTVTADLKKAEVELKKYGLSIERRPNYGIRLAGTEIHKRQYIIYSLLEKYPTLFHANEKEQLRQIAQCILPELNKRGIVIPELALKELFVRIYVANFRVRSGFSVNNEAERERGNAAEKGMAASLARGMLRQVEKQFGQAFDETEVAYIASWLTGNGYLKPNGNDTEKFQSAVIPDYIQMLASQMLSAIDESYQINLRGNLDLWMSLCQHLMPLEIRIKYGISSRNPLLEEIMNKYMFAFTIASQAAVSLAKAWDAAIPRDEIGYLAILFALALDKDSRPKRPKRVLLVCETERSSSQLLAYKLKKEFFEDIGSVEICDETGLEKKNPNSFDCIFTTVSLPQKYNKPVLELKMFLDTQDIVNARHILHRAGDGIFRAYFRPDLFFTGLNAENWQGIIGQMCRLTEERAGLPAGFEASVREREELAPTDYGNRIAMPHPMTTMTDESFVAVGILEKPVFWKSNEVQVVFLVSISRTAEDNLQDFYQGMTDFIMSGEKVDRLIEKQSFEELAAGWQ